MESILVAEYLGYEKMNTDIKNKSLLFTRMRKKVIERFQKNEFDSLKKDIKDNAIDQHFKEFFLSLEGRMVINWAIYSSSHSHALKFLYENIAPDVLQEALRYKNFSVLESFLLGESSSIFSKPTENDRKSRIEKMLILLKIDSPEVKNFFDEFESKYGANAEDKENFKKLKDDFDSAYEQFRQQNSALKL